MSFSLPVERHSVGFLLACLSFSLPAEGHFLNKTPFWGESFCQVSDILFGLVSFLSGAGLAAGVLLGLWAGLPVGSPICCLGVSLHAGKTFS